MNIIVDFEFTTLPRSYEIANPPEIFQCKMLNLSNGKAVCRNYSYNADNLSASAVVCYGSVPPQGEIPFSYAEFKRMLNDVGGNNDCSFMGYSIGTDKRVLLSYGIILENYIDIQELLRLTDLEYKLATQGCSLESAYYLVTGKILKKNTHSNIDELHFIKELYNYAYKNQTKNEFLQYYPFGEFAGMPIDLYCRLQRRKADGYRYNNDDLLSLTLSKKCIDIDMEYYDELYEGENDNGN